MSYFKSYSPFLRYINNSVSNSFFDQNLDGWSVSGTGATLTRDAASPIFGTGSAVVSAQDGQPAVASSLGVFSAGSRYVVNVFCSNVTGVWRIRQGAGTGTIDSQDLVDGWNSWSLTAVLSSLDEDRIAIISPSSDPATGRTITFDAIQAFQLN